MQLEDYYLNRKKNLKLTYILLKQLLSQLHFMLVKAEAIAIKQSKIKEEQFDVLLCKQVLGLGKQIVIQKF